MPDKKRIAIIGATGYTGSELVRFLHLHKGIEITAITSESRAGERFSDVHPVFRGITDDLLITADEALETSPDLAFLALPHGVSMSYAERFIARDIPVVDLSGDFRLDSPQTYTEWYKKEHTWPEGFKLAVYGMPEINRSDIKSAKLVANPGCYPTSSILPILPLLNSDYGPAGPIIIDAKSGTTGAGNKPGATTHFSNVNDNFKAYAIKTHRHSIEIQSILTHAASADQLIQFTPHLLPVDRGILSMIYIKPEKFPDVESLRNLYREAFADEPFLHLSDTPPAIKDVRGTNNCLVYVDADERTGLILLVSVIDNLVKGAAGQAIQNMNLMLGFDEHEGLHQTALIP